VVHADWRRDLREDFAVVRWTLHRQEAALAAAHHVEGYTHASRKDFGVMASSLLGHGWLLPINNAGRAAAVRLSPLPERSPTGADLGLFGILLKGSLPHNMTRAENVPSPSLNHL
jgi:hypothetical protein